MLILNSHYFRLISLAVFAINVVPDSQYIVYGVRVVQTCSRFSDYRCKRMLETYSDYSWSLKNRLSIAPRGGGTNAQMTDIELSSTAVYRVPRYFFTVHTVVEICSTAQPYFKPPRNGLWVKGGPAGWGPGWQFTIPKVPFSEGSKFRRVKIPKGQFSEGSKFRKINVFYNVRGGREGRSIYPGATDHGEQRLPRLGANKVLRIGTNYGYKVMFISYASIPK
jgi:hypothetical protein